MVANFSFNDSIKDIKHDFITGAKFIPVASYYDLHAGSLKCYEGKKINELKYILQPTTYFIPLMFGKLKKGICNVCWLHVDCSSLFLFRKNT